jgi:hypothetical protein
MGGEWRIRQQPPHGTGATGAGSGYRVDVIPFYDLVEENDGWSGDQYGLRFVHRDGRVTIYPWASIVRAEYVPDPADDQ